jgi:hypothetical protein
MGGSGKDGLNGVMRGKLRLQNDSASLRGGARTTDGVVEKLIHPFRRAKVRDVQAGVGLKDADETSARKGKMLKQGLRSDQNVP